MLSVVWSEKSKTNTKAKQTNTFLWLTFCGYFTIAIDRSRHHIVKTFLIKVRRIAIDIRRMAKKSRRNRQNCANRIKNSIPSTDTDVHRPCQNRIYFSFRLIVHSQILQKNEKKKTINFGSACVRQCANVWVLKHFSAKNSKERIDWLHVWRGERTKTCDDGKTKNSLIKKVKHDFRPNERIPFDRLFHLNRRLPSSSSSSFAYVISHSIVLFSFSPFFVSSFRSFYIKCSPNVNTDFV